MRCFNLTENDIISNLTENNIVDNIMYGYHESLNLYRDSILLAFYQELLSFEVLIEINLKEKTIENI